jgi:hypothetical protein
VKRQRAASGKCLVIRMGKDRQQPMCTGRIHAPGDMAKSLRCFFSRLLHFCSDMLCNVFNVPMGQQSWMNG